MSLVGVELCDYTARLLRYAAPKTTAAQPNPGPTTHAISHNHLISRGFTTMARRIATDKHCAFSQYILEEFRSKALQRSIAQAEREGQKAAT